MAEPAAAVLTPPPVTPSPQAIPDVSLQARPRVSNRILESAKAVRDQFEAQATTKRETEQARRTGLTQPKTGPSPEPTPGTVPEPKPGAETPGTPPPATPKADDPQAGLKTTITTDKETNMAALRKAREEAEARAQTLERQLAETQAKIPQDYEQLRKERELLISEIEKRDVTASPRFKEKFDKPMEQQLGQIKKTLGLTEVNPEEFLVLVQMPESKERNAKIGEMMEGLDRVSAGKVETALSQYDSIRDQRTQDIADPRASWQESQRDIQERQRTAQESQKAILESAIAAAERDIPWFKPIEGNDVWNKRLADIKQRARDFWSGAHSSEELAQLTMAGTLTPLFAESITLLSKENERLNEELAGLKGAKPRNAAGKTAGAEAAGKGKYEGFGSIGALVRAKALERRK